MNVGSADVLLVHSYCIYGAYESFLQFFTTFSPSDKQSEHHQCVDNNKGCKKSTNWNVSAITIPSTAIMDYYPAFSLLMCSHICIN